MTPDSPRSEPPRRPIELDAAYLAAIARVEALPENASGSDKTWVEAAIQAWNDHYAAAWAERDRWIRSSG